MLAALPERELLALSIEPKAPSADEHLSERERHWFGEALRALDRAGVPVLVAGGLALYHYTGFWRGCKDLDLLVLPEHKERAIAAVTAAGLADFHEEEPYDREWIFRTRQEDVIVDLIWRMANKADDIDASWFHRSTTGTLAGQSVQMVSAADLCWLKLFVFQAKRCDWPHILNIIRGTRGNLDWGHLVKEVGPHWRLLCALTDVFDWLCPQEREFIPEDFRLCLQQLRGANLDRAEMARNDLFDTRPWLTQPGAGFTGSAPERRRIRGVSRRKLIQGRAEVEPLLAGPLVGSSPSLAA